MLCILPDDINYLVRSNLVVAHKAQVTRGRRVLRKRLVLALLAASLKQLGNIHLCAIYAAAYVISLSNRRVELANCTELYVACIDIRAPARVICLVVLYRNKSRVNYQDIQQLLKCALDGEEILVGTVSAHSEDVSFNRKLFIGRLEYSAQFEETRLKVSGSDICVGNSHQGG